MKLEIILLAILFDFIIRESPGIRFHPLIYVGNLITRTWRKFKHKNPKIEKRNGMFYALTFILGSIFFVYSVLKFLEFSQLIHLIVSAVILKYCIAINSFFEHAKPVKDALKKGNLNDARKYVQSFVTRETSGLNRKQIISATIESIGENICDALISPLFYFVLFGIPGAVAVKMINLLDGMIGHKTKEMKNIGWFSARLDDIAQYIPARITGLLILFLSVLMNNHGNTWRILKRDRHKDDGINGGWTIAPMAGLLNVRLEKPNFYIVGEPKEMLSIKKINSALLVVPASALLFIMFLVILKLVQI